MNRFTVDAGTLDADVSAALRQEPITQRQQVLGDRSESFHRLSGFLAGMSDQQARDDRRLMYIEPTASLHNGVHLRLLSGEASTAPRVKSRTAMRRRAPPSTQEAEMDTIVERRSEHHTSQLQPHL